MASKQSKSDSDSESKAKPKQVRQQGPGNGKAKAKRSQNDKCTFKKCNFKTFDCDNFNVRRDEAKARQRQGKDETKTTII